MISTRTHLARAAFMLLLLLSPIGAPVVGALIMSVCPDDALVRPDGPFALGMSYCGAGRPIEHLYQHVVMISMMPLVMAGPLLGGLLTLAWWGLGLACLAAFLWHLAKAAAARGS